MMSFRALTIIAMLICADAFMASNQRSFNTQLEATSSDRRNFLRNVAGAAFGAAVVASNGESASASYSAYAAREKDWQERKESGEIQYSSARDLKRQLREIAPMNSENSKVFCPNGPSSAVSPLMENKCGDRMATPSVFGRTEDIVGNSIPGFSGGKYGSGTTTNLASELANMKY